MIRIALYFSLVLSILPANLAATILYSNTTTFLGQTIPLSGLIGDQVTLLSAGTGTTATIRLVNTGGAATFDADLLLYTLQSPAEMVFTSTNIIVGNGAIAPAFVDINFNLGGVALPQEILFLVAVNPVSGSPSFSLPLFNPPTIGSSDNSFYLTGGGRGGPTEVTATPGNIFFQLVGDSEVPEPATAGLFAIGAAALACFGARRR